MFVPTEVTTAKFERQLQRWDDNAEAYRRRGWLMLGGDGMCIDIGFIADVAFAQTPLSVITAAIRLDYTNFDAVPPSLTFINPRTGDPGPPAVRAADRIEGGEIRDALIDGHPETGLPFLCLPGIREYHSHPQHNGDDWLLHRALNEGDLAVICDRVWRRMVRNVLGVRVAVQALPVLGVQLEMMLAQGDPDAVRLAGGATS